MSPSRREDYDLAKDIWRARDQYQVENALIGCGLLALLLVCVFVLGVIVVATNYAIPAQPAPKAAIHPTQKGK